MGAKMSTEDFITRAKKIHGDKYIYSKTIYVNSDTQVIIECPNHGIFKQITYKHLAGTGCRSCAAKKNAQKRTITADVFFTKANTKYENKYNYSETIYENYDTDLIIHCPNHGPFIQKPKVHLKIGCTKCNLDNKSMTTEKFIAKSLKKHGNTYNYSKTACNRSTDIVTIICDIHGDFLQRVHDHLNGCGCSICNLNKRNNSFRKTTEEFISEAQQIHNGKYDYSLVDYKKSSIPISIICKKHGIFNQVPTHHIHKKAGCPNCSTNISNIGTEWLNYLNIPSKYHEITIQLGNKKIRPDAYISETNTVYEFWGDYWHGNLNVFNSNGVNTKAKKTFNQLYENTQKKRKLILDAGYNLIEIWEYDWLIIKKNKIITKQ